MEPTQLASKSHHHFLQGLLEPRCYEAGQALPWGLENLNSHCPRARLFPKSWVPTLSHRHTDSCWALRHPFYNEHLCQRAWIREPSWQETDRQMQKLHAFSSLVLSANDFSFSTYAHFYQKDPSSFKQTVCFRKDGEVGGIKAWASTPDHLGEVILLKVSLSTGTKIKQTMTSYRYIDI